MPIDGVAGYEGKDGDGTVYPMQAILRFCSPKRMVPTNPMVTLGSFGLLHVQATDSGELRYEGHTNSYILSFGIRVVATFLIGPLLCPWGVKVEFRISTRE